MGGGAQYTLKNSLHHKSGKFEIVTFDAAVFPKSVSTSMAE